MKQCINCLSENVSTIVEKNHIFYYCSNCLEKNSKVIDQDGNNFATKENGLVKHIAVGAIIEKNGKILFVKRQQYPYGFGIPASHLHSDENVEDTFRRMFSDKIGMNLISKKLVFHQTIIDPCRYGAELHDWYLFSCSVKSDLSFCEDNLVWVPKKELPTCDLIHSAQTLLSRLGYLNKKVSNPVISPPKKRTVSYENQDDQSILYNLPLSIISFNKKGRVIFRNRSAKTLLKSIEKDKRSYIKFTDSLKAIAQKTIDSRGDTSSNVKSIYSTYNIAASPLFEGGNSNGCVITIRDITDQRIQKARDVLAYKTSMALSADTSCTDIIKTILQQLFYALDISGVSLMLKEGNVLKVSHRYSRTETKKRKPLEFKIGEGVAGWAAEHKTSIAIPDTGKDPIFIGKPNIKSQSLLSVPVILNDDVLGVVSVSKRKNHYFTEDEMKMVTIVANRIAIAIENDKLYTRLSNDKKTLETVLSTTTDGLILLDKDLKLIFANEAAIAINQLTKDEVKNHHIKYFVQRTSEKNITKFLAAVRKSINMRKQLTFEFVSQKGPEKVVKTVFNPIIEKEGKCNSVLIGFNNVTKVKQKQALVQKKVKQITALFKISAISYDSSILFIKSILEKTRDILEASDSGLLFTDKNITLKSMENEEVNRIVKLKRFSILRSKQGLIFNNAKKDLLCQDISRIIIAPLRYKKQTLGYVYAINKKVSFNSEDLKILNIIAVKIASRIQSVVLVNQLENDWKKTHHIIESTADGIVAFDKNGNTLLWNKAMDQVTGFANVKEYIAKNPDKRNFIQDAFYDANRAKGDFRIQKRINVFNADGQKIWIDATYSVVKNQRGNGEIVVIALRDASKEVEIETQQKEFVYTATHELRTPLTAIKGYLSMILEGDAGEVNPMQKQYFSRAYSSTERLISLTEDLLKTTRLEENKMHYNKGLIDAQKLVDDVLSDYYKKAEDKGLTIVKKKAKKVKLSGDYDLTKHALSNLVDNAIKYSKKQGKIEVSLDSKGKFGYIAVEDSGVGIPIKEQSAVFNKFYRVYNSESVSAGGTGLGLFIVKNLIENQGGCVNIKSKLGKGSTFTMSMPLLKK